MMMNALPAYASTINRPGNNLNLVGYWKFDEGSGMRVADNSGNNHAATTSAVWSNGKLGKALNFDGTTYASDVGAGALGTNSISECAWVNFNSFGTTVFSSDPGSVIFTTRQDATNDKSPTLVVDKRGGDTAEYLTFAFDASGVATGAKGQTPIQTGQWYVMCGVFSNTGGDGAWSVYLNGVQDDPGGNNFFVAGNVALPFVGNNWYIGFEPPWLSTANLNGKIDEMRVYTRALSASEIMTLYHSGAARINASSATLNSGSSLTNGLVGYWTFDAKDIGTSILDRSGNGNNGGFVGGSTSSAMTIGKLGQALNFNGSDYVQLSDSTALDPGIGPFSVSVWFNSTSNCAIDCDIYQDYGAGIPQSAVAIDITQIGGIPTLEAFFRDDSQTNQVLYVSGGPPMNDSRWHHVVLVRNSQTTATVYLDGAVLGQNSNGSMGSVTVSTNGTPPRIGASSGVALNAPFVGKIDDVREYNRALSASEVAALYNSGAHVNASSATLTNGSTLKTGLVGHWTFDGPDITPSIVDRSGQGNNGGFIGGATSSAKTIGKMGQALKFDGANTYVDVPAASSLNITGSVSISMWTYANQATPSGHFLSLLEKRDAGTGPEAYGFEFNGKDTSCTSLNIAEPTMLWTTLNHTQFVEYGANVTATVGVWEHWVAVRDVPNTSVKFYRNGVDVGSTFIPTCSDSAGWSAPDSSSGDLGLASVSYNSGGAIDRFNGKMDDVRIYNRVLSPSEVKQLYLIGK
jgi:hypothetical protein